MNQKLNIMTSQCHYKMYKQGKHWVFAAITMAAFLTGGNLVTGSAVKAADISQQAETSTAVAKPTPSTNQSAPAQQNTAQVSPQTISRSGSKDTATATTPTSAKTTVNATAPMPAQTKTVSDVSSLVQIENTTTPYDGKSTTAARYRVKLADNLVPPSDWYMTANSHEYIVLADSGDIDTSAVNSTKPGTYSISLSAQGLAKLQQANPTAGLTSASVQTGTLTISPASVTANAITLQNTQKNYDNNPATDPKTVTIQLPSNLSPDGSWQAVAGHKGMYNIAIDSGDITWPDTQQVGSYSITLSTQGLKKLQLANPNYSFDSTAVKPAEYTILAVNRASITDTTIPLNVSKPPVNSPTSYLVSLNSNITVPNDWELIQSSAIPVTNTGLFYKVPAAYFDVPQMAFTSDAFYSINWSDETIKTLQSLNPGAGIEANQFSSGQVHVVSTTPATTTPSNNFASFVAGEDTGQQYLSIALNQTFALNLRMFGMGSNQITNLTQYLVFPAGFQVADSTTATTASTNPEQIIKTAITAVLNDPKAGLTYTPDSAGLEIQVTRVADYQGRQSFRVTINGTVQSQPSGSSLDPGGGDTKRNVVVPIIATNPNHITGDVMGPDLNFQDRAVIFTTDDAKYTQGAYVLRTTGARYYPSVPAVAAFFGISNAQVLSPYALASGSSTTPLFKNFRHEYTFVPSQDAHNPGQTQEVTDTYALLGPGGMSLGPDISFTGVTGDVYAPMAINSSSTTEIQKEITIDGKTYAIVEASVPGEQIFGAGSKHDVYYQEILADDIVKISDAEKDYDNNVATNPVSYVVTLAPELVAPEGWALVPGTTNQYTVTIASGDITVSTNQNSGQYPVTLTEAGRARLVQANSEYLIPEILSPGEFTIHETSSNPGNPSNPGTPSEPGNPSNPGTPSEPGNPSNPGTPSEPGNPSNPGLPGTPGNPSTPGNSSNNGHSTPGNPPSPGQPIASHSGANQMNGNNHLPQTGDQKQSGLAILGALLIGIISLGFYRGRKTN